MSPLSQDETSVITFRGVELVLPAPLPYWQRDNCLTLDFRAGYTGTLTIRPVSNTHAFSAPTLHLTGQSQQLQHQGSALVHHTLSGQLSQHPELSQGNYPPWLLQSSNPGLCLPDSVGTQSPLQRDRQPPAVPAESPMLSNQQPLYSQDQPAAVNLQQQEAHKRNAAALQELMTQADASEPEADDFIADTAADSAPADADASMQPPPNAAASASGLAANAQNAGSSQADDKPTNALVAEQTNSAFPAKRAKSVLPAEQPHGQAESSRGAGTPAGPLEEFYSPQEHFQENSSDQQVQQVPQPNPSKKADTADAQASHQQFAEIPLHHKTPAPAKRRKGAKSVPPSSKRRKATPAALAEESFAWRSLDNERGTDVALPGERWGASLTCIADKQVLLLGGGDQEGQMADAWLLDVGESAWVPMPATALPSARSWHSAHMLQREQGLQVVMYGGETAEQDENVGNQDDSKSSAPVACNELCLLEPDNKLWVPMTITGSGSKRPPRRSGHSCTVLPDGRLLIFGGLDEQERYKNDMFIMDANRMTWYSLAGTAKGAPPKPRAYHSATMVGDRLVVMGGVGIRAWSLKEVYTLNTETWKWTEHTSEVEGEAPSPRYGHAAVALPDGRHLATFGGCDEAEIMFFSSIALLDTLTWRWTTPKVQGTARPSGRSGHGMALTKMQDDKSGLIVFGGRSKGDLLHNDTWALEVPAFQQSGS